MENYLNIFDNRTGEFLKMTRPHVVKGRKYKETIILIDAQGIIVDISGKKKWGPEYGIPIIGQIGDGRFELRVNEDSLNVIIPHEEWNPKPIDNPGIAKYKTISEAMGAQTIPNFKGEVFQTFSIDIPGDGIIRFSSKPKNSEPDDERSVATEAQ